MLATIDIVVVITYAVFLFGLAQWVSREKSGHEKSARDYFLAGSSLPWWAIGASLIAANISAEQIIGMSGSGIASIRCRSFWNNATTTMFAWSWRSSGSVSMYS